MREPRSQNDERNSLIATTDQREVDPVKEEHWKESISRASSLSLLAMNVAEKESQEEESAGEVLLMLPKKALPPSYKPQPTWLKREEAPL